MCLHRYRAYTGNEIALWLLDLEYFAAKANYKIFKKLNPFQGYTGVSWDRTGQTLNCYQISNSAFSSFQALASCKQKKQLSGRRWAWVLVTGMCIRWRPRLNSQTNTIKNKEKKKMKTILSKYFMSICLISPPEVSNIQWRKAELNIILSRVNNFNIKQKMAYEC